ncbi:hypothetical protein [Streptomyces sp. NPDC002785]
MENVLRPLIVGGGSVVITQPAGRLVVPDSPRPTDEKPTGRDKSPRTGRG